MSPKEGCIPYDQELRVRAVLPILGVGLLSMESHPHSAEYGMPALCLLCREVPGVPMASFTTLPS